MKFGDIGTAEIHVDDVDQLGTFVEIETKIEAGESRGVASDSLLELARQLDCDREGFLRQSYLDLLELRERRADS